VLGEKFTLNSVRCYVLSEEGVANTVIVVKFGIGYSSIVSLWTLGGRIPETNCCLL